MEKLGLNSLSVALYLLFILILRLLETIMIRTSEDYEKNFQTLETMIESIVDRTDIIAVCPAIIKERALLNFRRTLLIMVATPGIIIWFSVVPELGSFLALVLLILVFIYQFTLSLVAIYARIIGTRVRPDAIILTAHEVIVVKGVIFDKSKGFGYEEHLRVNREDIRKKFSWYSLKFQILGEIVITAKKKPFTSHTKYYKKNVVTIREMREQMFPTM